MCCRMALCWMALDDIGVVTSEMLLDNAKLITVILRKLLMTQLIPLTLCISGWRDRAQCVLIRLPELPLLAEGQRLSN